VPVSHYHQLLVIVCLAMLGVGSISSGAITAPIHMMLRRWLTGVPPRERARLLLVFSAAPAVGGVLGALAIVLTFVQHEPRATTETAGLVLLLLAASGSVLVGAAVLRIVHGAHGTYKRHRLVERYGQRIDVPECPLPAWQIDTSFPVVAVSGVVRPRLILSAGILDECTAEELAVIARHEAAHARHRDNLVRACLLAVPDLFSLSDRGSAISRHWHRSVEEAADEEAVRSDPRAAVTLAGALLRVARMATSSPPAWMPALALYDGDNLEGRVRRLLARPPDTPQGRRPIAALGVCLIATAAAGVLSLTGTRPLHEVMEWAVHHLP
jgi:beta-lactamase regulating signal transducer with metallopeptidase domain